MKAYHWVLVIVLAVGAGYVGSFIQSGTSEAPTVVCAEDAEELEELVLMTSKISLSPSDIGLMQEKFEVKVPADHKLTLYKCIYRDGIYDGDESLGIVSLHRGDRAGFAVRLVNPEILTGDSGKVGLSIFVGGARLINKWIDRSQSHGLSSTSGVRVQVNRIFSFGNVRIDGTNRQYPAYQCEFYGMIEPMTEDELKQIKEVPNVTRIIRIAEPPEGVAAKLLPMPVD